MRRPALAMATLLAATAAALAAVEIGLRLLAPQVLVFEGIGLYLPDRDLGFRLAPGVTGRGRVVTSSLGLRDREVPLRKPSGVLRILALGDSFTYGMTERAATWPAQLETRLRQRFPGREIEVLNAGVPCYSTYQELAYLQRSLLQLDPDVVVLGFFVGNDFDDNIHGITHTAKDGELVPWWDLDEGSDSRIPVPRDLTPDTLWEDEPWPSPGSVRPARGLPALLRRLHTWRWMHRRVVVTRQIRAASAAEPPAEPKDPTKARRSQQRWYVGVQKDRLDIYDPERFTDERLEPTRGYLTAMSELLCRRAIPLVVLVIPDELQVHPSVRNLVLKRTRAEGRNLVVDLPQRRLAELLEPLGAPAVDVLAQFQRAGQRKKLYRPWDTHWNEAGNALGAQLVASYLQAVGLEPPLSCPPDHAPAVPASGP
jgi:hypothetical protein